jgi:hypothetical protein
VGMLAEVEPDGEIVRGLTLMHVKLNLDLAVLHTYPCGAIVFTC